MKPPIIPPPANSHRIQMSTWGWLIGIGSAILLACIFVVSIWVGLSRPVVFKSSPATVRELAPAGDGWTRYQIDDVGIQIDLPNRLRPEKRRFPKTAGLLFTSYSSYRAQENHINFSVYSVWNRSRKEDLEKYISKLSQKIQNDPNDADFSENHDFIDFHGFPAVNGAFRYEFKRQPSVSRYFAFARGKQIVLIRGTVWGSHELASQSAWKRIVDSIQISREN